MMQPQFYIEKEKTYGANNYKPLPVVIKKGSGIYLWDVEGNRYFDFLSAYSSVNQGHCHPKIIKALTGQSRILTLTSRAFYNDKLGMSEEYLAGIFQYDKVLFMNSGAEGVETALKLCRKWACLKKGIPENQSKIVVCHGNFHGRTISNISMSTDPDARRHFGPFTPGFIKIPYDDPAALQQVLDSDSSIAGFLVEPIQGEAGVMVPAEGYLEACRSMCRKSNVLFMADEIQTGLARTGKLLACDHEQVKPDVLILGKALSGGTFPISAILANDPVMLTIHPGEHGSTYGGSPLASVVAKTAVEVILEEHMAENARALGDLFRKELASVQSDIIAGIRGKGLLNAIEIATSQPITAWEVSMALKNNGLLAKPSHEHVIRLAPPLIIQKKELLEASGIIRHTLEKLSA